MDEYNCCGVLVHGAPGRVTRLREHLVALPGVDVHVVTEQARLVVTVEDVAGHRCADTLGEIQRLDGVLSAAVVYQYTDQPTSEQEPAS